MSDWACLGDRRKPLQTRMFANQTAHTTVLRVDTAQHRAAGHKACIHGLDPPLTRDTSVRARPGRGGVPRRDRVLPFERSPLADEQPRGFYV